MTPDFNTQKPNFLVKIRVEKPNIKESEAHKKYITSIT